jgi:hypothetical protein
MKGLPTGMVAGLALVLLCAPALSAQTANPSTPPPAAELKLEDLPSRLAKIDEQSGQQIQKLREVVETEAKEKRLSEPNALSLRWSLQTLTENLHTPEARTLLDTVRIPPDNQALSDAYRNVTTAVAGLKSQRSALLSQAQGLVRSEVSQAMTGHRTPAEMATDIVSLEKIRDQFPRGPYPTSDHQAVSGGVELLKWLRRLADAEATGEPSRINAVVDEWTTVQTSAFGLYSESERKERINRATETYLGKVAAAFKSLDAQIAAGKPAAECEPTLAPAEAILNQPDSSPGQAYNRLNDARLAMAIYRQIVNALKAMEGGNFTEAQGYLREAKNATYQSSGSLSPTARNTATTLEVDLAERAGKQVAEQRGTLARKIVEAKDPADLRKYVEELTRLNAVMNQVSTPRRTNESVDWSGLTAELATLATAWENSNLALIQQQSRFTELRGQNLPFGDEMANLRQRVQRDILVQLLKAPELKQAPMSGQPLETAMESLANDLAAHGEWRRLYKLIETQVALAPNEERPAQRQSLEALTSFFAGQNLELAEQWTDAIESYKAVLRNPAERSPAAVAAERIKAISKAHPQPASTPAPRQTP